VFVHVYSFVHSFANIGQWPFSAALLQLTLNYLCELFISERMLIKLPLLAEDQEGHQQREEVSLMFITLE
jgi:hypothetical protein